MTSDYSHPRIILREDKDKDPVGIKIRVKKPKKTRSLERPVCFRVKDNFPPAFRTRYVPSEPAYEVAPVVYVNSDGTSRCGPNETVVETLKNPDCGCPLDESVVEKSISKERSDDEPLVIRIGPTGGFGNGCEEKPVYKINFKDNVMNVTSNVDFLVKKMERTQSTIEREPDAQKYLIKPILKHIPPVTVTVRPNPIGNQASSTHETSSSEERSSTRTRTVPNEYAEKTSTRTRTVPQTGLLSPEAIAALFQQQQQPAQVSPLAPLAALAAIAYQQPAQAAPLAYQQPAQAAPFAYQQPAISGQTGQYQFTPEQIAAAYQQQQVGLPNQPGMMQITPEQMARGYREQQGAPISQFSPEELAEAYRQQQGAQGGPQFTPEQVAAAVREQQGGPRAATAVIQPGVYPSAPQQYAQTQAQPQQAYAYPQAQVQPQAYAYPQAQAQPQPQQPFQFSQFPQQVGA